MCDGGSWSSTCRMYSPKSVSITSQPTDSRASFKLISSVTIDFDLTIFLALLSCATCFTYSLASSAVLAKTHVRLFGLHFQQVHVSNNQD